MSTKASNTRCKFNFVNLTFRKAWTPSNTVTVSQGRVPKTASVWAGALAGATRFGLNTWNYMGPLLSSSPSCSIGGNIF